MNMIRQARRKISLHIKKRTHEKAPVVGESWDVTVGKDVVLKGARERDFFGRDEIKISEQ